MPFSNAADRRPGPELPEDQRARHEEELVADREQQHVDAEADDAADLRPVEAAEAEPRAGVALRLTMTAAERELERASGSRVIDASIVSDASARSQTTISAQPEERCRRCMIAFRTRKSRWAVMIADGHLGHEAERELQHRDEERGARLARRRPRSASVAVHVPRVEERIHDEARRRTPRRARRRGRATSRSRSTG